MGGHSVYAHAMVCHVFVFRDWFTFSESSSSQRVCNILYKVTCLHVCTSIAKRYVG